MARARLEQIVQAVHRLDREPVVVGIDGQSGAGKSTLAGRLARSFGDRATVITGDDFYREMPETERLALTPEEGYHRYFDWERLRAQVLLPAREGADTLCHQRFDWDHGRLGAPAEVAVRPVVILEGAYTLRRQLRDLLDVKVYVTTDAPTRQARLIARAENSSDWIQRWVAAEDLYVIRERPNEIADFVISGG